ncbi:MAG: deaminase [Patescibacteria group bacterium]
MQNKTALVCYVPVLHEGYIKFFSKYPGATLYILGRDVIIDYLSLVRDPRGMDPEVLKTPIESLGIFSEVKVLTKKDLENFSIENIVMPDENVTRDLAAKYFVGKKVVFESVFLRWDQIKSTTEFVVPADRVISTDEADKEIMAKAMKVADRSPDWWRQIAAIIIKDGKVVSETYNTHLPSDFHLQKNGDPRSNFNAGEMQQIFTSIHAEARGIAEAANKGISLDGAVAYVTTFPCPNCARLMMFAGIKKVYYSKGYSLLDAENILKIAGIEIVMVKMD